MAWLQRARKIGRAHLTQNPIGANPALHERCFRDDHFLSKRNFWKKKKNSKCMSDKATTESDLYTTPAQHIAQAAYFLMEKLLGPKTTRVLFEILWLNSRITGAEGDILCLVPFSSNEIYFKIHNSEGLEVIREAHRPSKDMNESLALLLGRVFRFRQF